MGHAGQIGRAPGGPAGVAETEDFLAAIARIGALEHEADDAQRRLAASAVQHARDFRQLHLFAAVGDTLEAAADALKHAGFCASRCWSMWSMADRPGHVQMDELYPIWPGSPLAPGGARDVGNKAWNLMRMAKAGLPIPPAFVLPTAWCGRADATARLPAVLAEGVSGLEVAAHLVFGASRTPLLVSVRSGAAISMPGMMETVLTGC